MLHERGSLDLRSDTNPDHLYFLQLIGVFMEIINHL